MTNMEDTWAAVDAYIDDQLLGADAALEHALRASAAAGLPAIAVSPSQGKFLFILAQAMGARRILELGTLGGYSTIWLARALPADGRLVTVEVDPKHAEVAKRNIERAGVSSVASVRVGAALDLLTQLQAEREGPFDFVFIDADKGHYPEYLESSVKLCRPGSLIVVDNVVREGAVIDATSEDSSVRAVRRFMDRLAANRQLDATVIQTVGVKGYDGFAIVRVGTS